MSSVLGRLIGIGIVISCIAGCAVPATVAAPVADVKAVREADTLERVRRLGHDGDWLVIRGYHATDDFVSVVTNTPWSHAAVLDVEKDEVIEAEGQGIHTTSLPAFIAKAHRLLLVRPDWSTETSARAALIKARALVGNRYDFLGLVALNVPDRYYCSELAVAVYRSHIPAGEPIPRPVTPAQLHHWGKILYDSGNP